MQEQVSFCLLTAQHPTSLIKPHLKTLFVSKPLRIGNTEESITIITCGRGFFPYAELSDDVLNARIKEFSSLSVVQEKVWKNNQIRSV